VTRPAVPLSRHLLRVRDLIDRAYAERLDVAALARSASVSQAISAGVSSRRSARRRINTS
jgi:hypothetical protein